MNPFHSVPFEIIDHILILAGSETVSSVSRTSHGFHAYIQNNRFLWKSLFIGSFDLSEGYDHSTNWKCQVQCRIRAKHTILAFPSRKISAQELESAFEILVQVARSALPGWGSSKNVTWLNDIFTTPALSRPHPPVIPGSSQSNPHLQLWSELQVLEYDKVGSRRNRFEARAFVYDMRNYRRSSLYGPFLPRSFHDEPLRIDYIHLRHLMNVLQSIVRGSLHDFPRVWTFGFEMTRSMTAPLSSVDGDWAGVQGFWRYIILWARYQDLVRYNWPIGELPDITDEPDLSVFRNSRFAQAYAYLGVTTHVTSIDPPFGRYPGRKPTIHFEGSTCRGVPTGTQVWGTVRDEGEEVIRWTVNSNVGGEMELRTEGVQIGGVQSAAGWVGCWTVPAHEPFDPAGPSMAYKIC